MDLLEKENVNPAWSSSTVQAEEGQYRMQSAPCGAEPNLRKIKDQALPDDISEFLCGQWLRVLVFLPALR